MVTVREEISNAEWNVSSSKATPTNIFVLLKGKRDSPNIFKTLGHVEVAGGDFYSHKYLEGFHFPNHVSEVSCPSDCENIPLWENQLGFKSDLKTLERYRQMVRKLGRQFSGTKKRINPLPSETYFAKENSSDTTDSCERETPKTTGLAFLQKVLERRRKRQKRQKLLFWSTFLAKGEVFNSSDIQRVRFFSDTLLWSPCTFLFLIFLTENEILSRKAREVQTNICNYSSHLDKIHEDLIDIQNKGKKGPRKNQSSAWLETFREPLRRQMKTKFIN